MLHITHREQQQKTYLRFLTEKEICLLIIHEFPLNILTTETVLFNREYCHLSLFYLTFTLFFFFLPDNAAKLSWMACKII